MGEGQPAAARVRRRLDAIGRRVSLSGPKGPWLEVVGLVADTKYRSLTEATTPIAYVPDEMATPEVPSAQMPGEPEHLT